MKHNTIRSLLLVFFLVFCLLFTACNGQLPSDGETPDGETPDGETPDGETSDGETPDGETPDGETPDGETPDGETPDGETPDGETPDGGDEMKYSEGLAFASLSDGTCAVTGIGTCTDTYLWIPPTSPAGEKVTKIGFGAFASCTSLTSITLPDSIESIEARAFEYCTSLAYILIPEGVKSFQSLAFKGCTSLASITLPESLTDIGSDVFANCTALTSILIPSSVNHIGSSPFVGCSSLSSIMVDERNPIFHSAGNCLIETEAKKLIVGCKESIIPADGTVETIEREAFARCTSLTSIVIPEGVTTIETGAFEGCTSLTSIVIPEGVTTIEAGVFEGCTSLTSIVIPEGVTTIETRAFEGCTSLASITLPDSLTTIEMWAFEDCTSLASIVIPEGVTTIETQAFEGCTSLASITLPDSITSIEWKAFENTAYFNTDASWESSVLYIGNHLIAAKDSLPESYTIKEGTICIADRAFLSCFDLEELIIPDSVVAIGEKAFLDCHSLSSLTLGSGVTSIGKNAFCHDSIEELIVSEKHPVLAAKGNNLVRKLTEEELDDIPFPLYFFDGVIWQPWEECDPFEQEWYTIVLAFGDIVPDPSVIHISAGALDVDTAYIIPPTILAVQGLDQEGYDDQPIVLTSPFTRLEECNINSMIFAYLYDDFWAFLPDRCMPIEKAFILAESILYSLENGSRYGWFCLKEDYTSYGLLSYLSFEGIYEEGQEYIYILPDVTVVNDSDPENPVFYSLCVYYSHIMEDGQAYYRIDGIDLVPADLPQ